MTQSKAKTLATDIAFYFLGCTLMAISVRVFDAPNNIAPGGVTGISILVNYLTGLPIALVSFAINIPLLISAYLFLGKSFTLKTLTTVLISTLMVELVGRFVPVYQGDTILAALYGGVFTGTGLGLVFMRSSTTGGTDIVMRLIQRKQPELPTGKLMMILDGFVLILAAIVYGNVENALFAMINIFTCSRVIDSILYGLDVGKMMMIITEKYDEVTQQVQDRTGRGCTLLSGKGGYTRQDRPVILCVVRKAQYYELKKTVHAIDASAFMVAMEASEVIGEGFKVLEQPPGK